MAFTYLTLLLLVYVLTRFWSPLYLIVPLFCKSWIGATFLSILAVAEIFFSFLNKLVIEKTIGTGIFSFRYLSFQLVWISVWIFFFFFPYFFFEIKRKKENQCKEEVILGVGSF